MRRAIWSRKAQNDLARIDEFHANIDGDYAAKVGRLAIKAGQYLAQNSRIAPFVDDSNVRKWGVLGTRFVLLYAETGEGVMILRLRHARENWREEI